MDAPDRLPVLDRGPPLDGRAHGRGRSASADRRAGLPHVRAAFAAATLDRRGQPGRHNRHLAANLVYAVARAPWVRPLGDLATTGVGIAVHVRLLRLFPFSFGAWSFDWSPIVRVLLVVGFVGSVIGMVAQGVALVRALGGTAGRTAETS